MRFEQLQKVTQIPGIVPAAKGSAKSRKNARFRYALQGLTQRKPGKRAKSASVLGKFVNLRAVEELSCK